MEKLPLATDSVPIASEGVADTLGDGPHAYYSNWPESVGGCVCGWVGSAADLIPRLNIYEFALDFQCPRCCNRTVLTVDLPSLREIERAGIVGDEDALRYLDTAKAELKAEGFVFRDFGVWTTDIDTWTSRQTRFDLERVVGLRHRSYYLLSIGEAIDAPDDATARAVVEEQYLGITTERETGPPGTATEPSGRAVSDIPSANASDEGSFSRSKAPNRRPYYSDWQLESFECPCGWAGRGSELTPDIEIRESLSDYECPRCQEPVLDVEIPTMEDIEHAGTGGDAEALRLLARANETLTDEGFTLRRSGVWTKDIAEWTPADRRFALERIIPIRGEGYYMLWTTETIGAATDDGARAMVEELYLSTDIKQLTAPPGSTPGTMTRLEKET